jgi:hypothetical protein
LEGIMIMVKVMMMLMIMVTMIVMAAMAKLKTTAIEHKLLSLNYLINFSSFFLSHSKFFHMNGFFHELKKKNKANVYLKAPSCWIQVHQL